MPSLRLMLYFGLCFLMSLFSKSNASSSLSTRIGSTSTMFLTRSCVLPRIISIMALELDQNKNDYLDQPILKEMLEAGVIYGRKKSILHPTAKKYISGVHGDVVLFDLTKTQELLDKAAEFLKDLKSKKGLVLIVGTRPGVAETIKDFADKHGFAFVTNRWLGGTLTNFKEMNGRLQYFLKLRDDFSVGKYTKYPKKERTKLKQELDKLTIKWSGLELLKKLPEAVIIIDIDKHTTALNEARQLKIPVVAIANSNTKFDDLDYPIPANSNAPASVKWIINYIDKQLTINN